MSGKDDLILEVFRTFINENPSANEADPPKKKEEDTTNYSSLVKTEPYVSANLSTSASEKALSRVGISSIESQGSDTLTAFSAIRTWLERNSDLKTVINLKNTGKGIESQLTASQTVEILKLILVASLKTKKISFNQGGVRIVAEDAKSEDVGCYFNIRSM